MDMDIFEAAAFINATVPGDCDTCLLRDECYGMPGGCNDYVYDVDEFSSTD